MWNCNEEAILVRIVIANMILFLTALSIGHSRICDDLEGTSFLSEGEQTKLLGLGEKASLLSLGEKAELLNFGEETKIR